MTETPLPREEYVEQRHFFRTLRGRLAEGVPTQEALGQVREELLATTRLPVAIDLLNDELRQSGRMSPAMERLNFYFTPFQAFVVGKGEEDRTKFDSTLAFLILERLAGYMTGDRPIRSEAREVDDAPSRRGLFLYQFETLARSRLGYTAGLTAVAADPFYDETWSGWIKTMRRAIGEVDFAELLYRRSGWFLELKRRADGDREVTVPFDLLFGEAEGRIAWANRGKDPLYLFAALQRQLGYPEVPRPPRTARAEEIPPAVQAQLHRLERRLQFLEAEQKGGLNLDELAVRADRPAFRDEPNRLPPPGRP
ncbi:hypothetical protein [Alienimonas californiensis]|uniref:Uncharacterized protein n=1 Tax=Alienimonas californiensis TaxID=2527989 RepID=A0A517PC26_9PLAN|nr:hypothetical protein [Alienimonas californiensis]QDT16909.1 hypothetical protein CA12_30170 [Alienimonas californiensis]